MKIIYTAIFGDYEELKEPSIISEGWQYICFTDQPLKSDIWEIRPFKVIDTPQRTARWLKIMGWIDWQYSMWIDASFQINQDLNEWWDKRFISPFSCARHPLRSSIYAECTSCINNHRGDNGKVLAQHKKYFDLKVPGTTGIITSGILLRENTPENIALHEAWWTEISEQSVRDQLAFAFVSWQRGFTPNLYQWDYSQSKEFKFIRHKHLRQ